MPHANGALQCARCGAHNNEIVDEDADENASWVWCRICDNEWTIYTGSKCPICESRHTSEEDVVLDGGFTQYTKITCYECDSMTKVS